MKINKEIILNWLNKDLAAIIVLCGLILIEIFLMYNSIYVFGVIGVLSDYNAYITLTIAFIIIMITFVLISIRVTLDILKNGIIRKDLL